MNNIVAARHEKRLYVKFRTSVFYAMNDEQDKAFISLFRGCLNFHKIQHK